MEEITYEITGRQRRSDVDGKVLEVPCVYTSLHGKAKKLLKLLLVKESTNS